MVADVPVGAFLSGGIDSSAVVALMSRSSGRPVETVTVSNAGFPDLDEWESAERVAHHLGARAHRVDVLERDAIEALPKLAWHMDEPISDPAALNTYFAARSLRANGIKVALVGEGADEAFLGYGAFLKYQRLARLLPLGRHLPSPVLRAGEAVGRTALSLLGKSGHADLLGRALQGKPVFLGTELFFQDSEKPAYLGGELPARYPSSSVASAIQADASAPIRHDALSLFSFSDLRMRMAEKLLMRVDKMASAHSIEVRSPFLDHALVNYALSLPAHVRAAHGVTKHILREAVAPFIPAEVLHRRKQGFSTPVAAWLRGEMGRHFQARIEAGGIFRDGVLKREPAQRLLARHQAGDATHGATHTRLWNLLMLVEWYDRFDIQGLGPESALDIGQTA